MSQFCPSCGFNLVSDKTIARDGFLLDPRGSAAYRGRDIDLTSGEALLLHAIAAQHGRVVPSATLGQRISDSEDPRNVAQVFICRVRQKLHGAALPVPFHNVRGRGYAWGLQ
jgi:DNA-binding response OmpR family regulator